ncbi:MAG: cation diffusion facilitator family transporter [Rhodocyclaceae bacterium]|nr:cation diffusion facilitator family transporter [Rhodocyclaceae bacterium]
MSAHNAGSTRAILYALGANLGIAVSKFGAAWRTNSGSMLAEAIHSTADCVNQLLLLLGMREAKRPESADHPLGYHRVTYFWSMIVALLLFFMGGAFSVYEGIERLRHPHPLENGLVALIVLGLAVVLEAFSLAGAMREIRQGRARQVLPALVPRDA